ncbi:hypothetical protein P691DRAFT_811897 [Macrolepiota fuliginosa MF-IS2]|uniref:Uncharacterized protein n=1 Tax=Macrolepiota fuliginosa MF-IS2 TaxID=1400762 RepID=A0A9P6BXN5_9AGAR|nr:hypothetical protein P691DRAFT_811897 [Macrolepiota fuliginosa MF-IS2]
MHRVRVQALPFLLRTYAHAHPLYIPIKHRRQEEEKQQMFVPEMLGATLKLANGLLRKELCQGHSRYLLLRPRC